MPHHLREGIRQRDHRVTSKAERGTTRKPGQDHSWPGFLRARPMHRISSAGIVPWFLGLSASASVVAVAAVDRAIATRNERHLRFGTTRVTDRRVHLAANGTFSGRSSGSAGHDVGEDRASRLRVGGDDVGVAFGALPTPTGWTKFREGEPVLVPEGEFSGGDDEFLSASDAGTIDGNGKRGWIRHWRPVWRLGIEPGFTGKAAS